ncbi:protein phosphatase 1 regulatory subunit 36, transcript variant X2 [Ictidomys tridecemlineatus]|nr:protein phosphatase 1 regulatory subunit 36, transcript variant X2 [Ictidomys tridecemlineatus]
MYRLPESKRKRWDKQAPSRQDVQTACVLPSPGAGEGGPALPDRQSAPRATVAGSAGARDNNLPAPARPRPLLRSVTSSTGGSPPSSGTGSSQKHTSMFAHKNRPREQSGLQLGMWYWKDETKTLEFRRLTDKRLSSREDKSAKALEKRGQQGNVTLDDVKFVALLLLQDTEMQKICSFTTFMRNKNLDNFLMALLYYLSHYLEKNSLEKKPESYMVGLVEKKEMELVLSKLEAAQKYLAQKYCVLVLGLGMPDKHHMCCGKEKMSDTQKDWKFFESLFTFCTHVAWIVFQRQHLTEIEEEIGRLFRSNMFNIPRRKREDEESGGEKKRMTFVQFRRMMAKRPAIKKAVNMRSPVLSTLLPSLREKAQNIVEKKYHLVGIKLPGRVQKHMQSLDSVPMSVVGILGEPRCLFNPHTLLPLEPKENAKSSKRLPSLVERNNNQIQDTLES